MSSPSFAEELRSRGDQALTELFAARPDLLTPVPTDISALAARANSQPSLFRARDQLTQWELDVLTAMVILPEPFSELEVLQLVGKEAINTIDFSGCADLHIEMARSTGFLQMSAPLSANFLLGSDHTPQINKSEGTQDCSRWSNSTSRTNGMGSTTRTSCRC